MNLDVITVVDCLELFCRKMKRPVIHNSKVVDFEQTEETEWLKWQGMYQAKMKEIYQKG